MSDAERGDQATLFPGTVGERLRAAREALGMSLAEVASRTRVPLRHLEAIETSNFAGLPSATYAVGFVRSYARAVGADEVSLAHDTRIEVANTARPASPYQPYEIADPSRVPSRGLTIVAAGLGIAVIVLAVLWFATGFGRGGGTEQAAAPAVVTAVPGPAASPSASAGAGQVRITANDEVWMRVYDAADKTLFTGTLKAGDVFDVPASADRPMINIGRPDKVTITLNGSAVAPLGTGERAIKDVGIGAAALAARAAGTPAPGPSPSASATSTVPTAFSRPSAPRQRQPRVRPQDLVKPSTDRETERANERSPEPPPAPTPAPSGTPGA